MAWCYKLAFLVLIVTALAFAAGCGSDDEPETPRACLSPAPVYLEALEQAPGEVRLEGTTPISACLVAEQESGPLAQAGESMIGAATQLNRDLRDEFDPDAATQLGYLVGAVQRGAQETGGIHEDLVLRLDAAARHGGGDGQFDARFERAYGRGYAAGQEQG